MSIGINIRVVSMTWFDSGDHPRCVRRSEDVLICRSIDAFWGVDICRIWHYCRRTRVLGVKMLPRWELGKPRRMMAKELMQASKTWLEASQRICLSNRNLWRVLGSHHRDTQRSATRVPPHFSINPTAESRRTDFTETMPLRCNGNNAGAMLRCFNE